jgi:hypothetical protein
MSSDDAEVTVQMIGPRRPNPRLAPGEEASGALTAVSRACRLTILWRDAAAIVVRYPRRWVRLGLELRISARVPPLVGVEVLADDRRRACEER